ncbi:NUDIX domain-containing protein [Streptomyces aureus]
MAAGLAAFAAGPDKDLWWHADHALLYLVDHPAANDPSESAVCGQALTRHLYQDGKSWNVEYWSRQQITEVISGLETECALPRTSELRLLDALWRGPVLAGADRVADWRRELTASKVPERCRDLLFARARREIELSAAFAAASASHGAVLSAAAATSHAIDGILAAHGHLLPDHAARYQRYADLCAQLSPGECVVSPEEYWRLQTMRDLDPDAPQRWVRGAIQACLAIIADPDVTGYPELLREIAAPSYKRGKVMHDSSDSIRYLTPRDRAAAENEDYTARGAVVIVVNDRGQVLLNLRDDKPDILHPNRWSVLGGLCEDGEDEQAAACRELVEEAALIAETVLPGWRFVDWEGRKHLLTSFIVPTNATLAELELGEGQDLRFFNEDEVLGLQLVPFVKPLLQAFFEQRRAAGYSPGSESEPAKDRT